MIKEKIVLMAFVMTFSTLVVAQTQKKDIKSKDSTNYIYATAKKIEKSTDILTAHVAIETNTPPKTSKPLPPANKHSYNTDFFKESKDEFGEDIDQDFEVPSDELYGFNWTSEYINPYKIKIEDLPDSVMIDCKGFIFPVVKSSSNVVTSNFGSRRHRYHYGTDIGLSIGDSIVSAFDGTVRVVDYDARGYGKFIVVRHSNGLESLYGHLSKPLVTPNQVVKAGQLIGLGGNTGRSSGPHLHFEFRFLGNPFNTDKIVDYTTEKCYDNNYWLTKSDTYNHKSDVERLKQMQYHRVRKGETLSLIAKRYGTTVNKLCKLNHISRSSNIRPGRAIRYR